ncbi:MAG: 16S rRNA pseudouridine516 synthase [Myxococcota bacterium]|jgi:16S rRNA pseudouridine516 synthase
MRLDRRLANLGYGSRKDVTKLLKKGHVTDADGSRLGPSDTDPGGEVRIDGEPMDPRALTLLLNKPVDLTCSHRDGGATVYGLFPPRYSLRRPPLSTIGRLDKSTSGLLLLTDDGALLHRIAAPRRAVAKAYRATLARPLPKGAAARLASGTLMLRSEATPCRPARLEVVTPLSVRLVVTEGRYHLVRRMLAALGSHVETLHRERVGALSLPSDLPPGSWRPATDEEVAAACASEAPSSDGAPSTV